MPSDWERVSGDPVLLAALRRTYTGPGDPLDLLWWVEHPGARTPAGLTDPATAVEAARRALFRREPAATTPEAVERAAAASVADRDAARAALASADAELSASPRALRAGPVRRQMRVAMAGGVIVAVLVGGGIGFAAGRFTRATTPAAVAVFARQQRTDDRPPSVADLPTFIPRSSTRYLGESSTTGVVAYGAKTADGRICLVAVVLAARFTATCATADVFATEGLSLSLEATADPPSDSGIGTVQEVDPHWSPAGRLTF